MAKPRIGDRTHAVNPSIPFNSSSANHALEVSDLEDYIEDSFDKAQALIAVALWGEGLNSCSASIQHNFLSVLDDLLEKAKNGFDEMRKIKPN